MTLVSRVFSVGTAVCLITAVPAAADPVRITSGSVVWGSTGVDIPVTLSGDGFTFTGTTDVVEGLFTPRDQCSAPECVAGTTVDLRSLWLGNAFHGATATFEGRTFTAVGSLSSDASLLTEWAGALAIPTNFAGGTLTAPIALTGEFVFADGPAPAVRRVGLFGSGTATLTFSPWAAFPGAFTLDSLRYDLSSEASATPEPASMLLLATGLVGLVGARRRQRRDANLAG
jgi:hypothetical protein